MTPTSNTSALATCAVALMAAAGCDGWFPKDACKQGEQSCDGKQILMCTADGLTRETSWQKFASCGISGPGLVCNLNEGLAECVPESSLDAGRTDGGALSGFGGTAFGRPGVSAIQPNATTQEVEWARLEVHRAESASGYEIAEVSSSMLAFAPSAPSIGEVAAVAYEGSKPVDATLVSFQGPSRATSAWLRGSGVTRIALLSSTGAVLAEKVRGTTPPSSPPAKLGRVSQSLTVALPPTLKVYASGKDLGWVAGSDIPVMTVLPTEEMLRLVADAMKRLTPVAASTLTHVAFTSDTESFFELVESIHKAKQVEGADGGMFVVREGSGVDGGVPPVAPPPRWLRDQAYTSLVGSLLVINVADDMMMRYRAQPSLLTLEILRQVGALFVGMTSSREDDVFASNHFKFPADFPKDVSALIQQRVTPLLSPRETFRQAWGSLHNIAVEGGIAEPYRLVGTPSDAEAVSAGFAAGPGALGPGPDFSEYLARLVLPESWSPSPCETLRSTPLSQVPPRTLVHLAKIEAVWGLGYISSEQLRACVGDLALPEPGSGVRVHTVDQGALAFNQDVLGSHSPYLNEEMHVSLFGRREDGTQAVLDVGFRGLPGLFRIVPVDRRPDPRVGAGVFMSNPRSDSKWQASGGLLLVTRVDETRIEAHALMVYSAVNYFGLQKQTKLFPLVTARYDIPEDQRLTKPVEE